MEVHDNPTTSPVDGPTQWPLRWVLGGWWCGARSPLSQLSHAAPPAPPSPVPCTHPLSSAHKLTPRRPAHRLLAPPTHCPRPPAPRPCLPVALLQAPAAAAGGAAGHCAGHPGQGRLHPGPEPRGGGFRPAGSGLTDTALPWTCALSVLPDSTRNSISGSELRCPLNSALACHTILALESFLEHDIRHEMENNSGIACSFYALHTL